MNAYKRLFGSGPIGLAISVALFFVAMQMKQAFNIPDIFIESKCVPIIIFIALTAISVMLIVWSVVSLNPKERGMSLVTTGALTYFRHPLYAAFLSAFNFGFAFFLNNWVFVIWAFSLHPIWHLLVGKEEKDLKIAFPNEYEEYCKRTGRFFPKMFNKSRS